MSAKRLLAPRHPLTREDRASKPIYGLCREEHPRFTINHRVERPTALECHDRPSRSIGLQGSNPEVLLARENQSATTGVHPRHLVIRKPTDEAHVSIGQPLERSAHGPITDHEEGTAEAVEGLDGEVHPLVAVEPRDHKEIILVCRVGDVPCDVHRRRDDGAGPPIDPADASRRD